MLGWAEFRLRFSKQGGVWSHIYSYSTKQVTTRHKEVWNLFFVCKILFLLLLTRYCRWPINCKPFNHVSWESEERCSFLLLFDESCHSSRTVDGLQLRLEIKYFYLSLFRPDSSQWLVSSLCHLETRKQNQLLGITGKIKSKLQFT